ncbi:hypothetical protein IW139_003766 [Coemansia sp. RSA 353]|nr:hypothetical protein LPJ58_001241 [Coemansia sp. RSA 1591]KAJ1765608.1 hypothetical protein LPJ69_001209 [Coemansia sp. RSA 1752]KAJ1785745.1 hypothetical protein LPJ62_004091 [Coemansia sp. RSA 2167]KAJ1793800.1 hypothetical protein LPJ67_001171 [Coemansia sp. RSA 1938]KAJ2137705.1 hypothetical protein GGH17_001448 [Coemansia sp. RSA 788]KAJ2141221.1 hypothetical protein IW142_004985 [Coemansia sp. RSA 564]KAJ2155751.1 hypothetical protein J3F82_000234 [Coemansia sp. RSA 637]KAJ2169398.1
MADKTREISVVVIGGSYAGAAAAKQLAVLSKKGYSGLKVTLVDQSTHYFHAIGFPKALVDAEYAESAFLPFADFFPNGTKHEFVNQKLSRVLDEHHVELDNGQELYYDYLVLATGGQAPGPINVVGRTKDEGVAEIRQLREGLDNADSVLVVGGGAVGVEVAGFVAEKYPGKRVTLVHSRARLLPEHFRPGLSNGAIDKLGRLGVKVVLNDKVEIPSDFGYASNVGHRVLHGTTSGNDYASDVQILAVGFRLHTEYVEPLEQVLGHSLREPTSGALRVRPTLQLENSAVPHIYVPGDVNNLPGSTKFGFKAEMQGNTAAGNIKKMIASGFDKAFKSADNAQAVAEAAPKASAWSDYVDLMLVPIGPDLGVAQVLKIALGSSGLANLFVRQLKSKDFMLGMRKGYFPKSKKAKRE